MNEYSYTTQYTEDLSDGPRNLKVYRVTGGKGKVFYRNEE